MHWTQLLNYQRIILYSEYRGTFFNGLCYKKVEIHKSFHILKYQKTTNRS